MAKCDLSIELEDPERVRSGGETVRGSVHVRADADVRCNGLRVRTIWETHGRGNVTSGENNAQVLFQGDWQAGREYRYPFELTAARWPPTYHGHYLNLDHYVEARADIPWAFDPKTKHAFPVAAVDGPENFTDNRATELHGCAGRVGGLVGGGIVLVVGLMFLLNPFFWVIGALLGMGAAVWWFFFRWLPKHRLGQVNYSLEAERLDPGKPLRGMLAVRPPRDVAVNAITWTVTAAEVCVSGSGSNRKTHRYTAFEQVQDVLPVGTIRGGRESKFPLRIDLPNRPIYSLDLNDNDLIWTATLRIDIPRWPDWKHTQTFQVVPAIEGAAPPATSPPLGEAPAAMSAVVAHESVMAASAAAPTAAVASVDEPAISFAETMRFFWEARENEAQIEQLLEAVVGLPMAVSAVIERRLLYDSGSSASQDGYVVWAHFTDPPTPLTLQIPKHLADEFDQFGGDQWDGRGSITGYDRRHRRVKIEVEA